MKRTKLLLVTLTLSVAMSFTVLASGWKQDESGWWYENNDGSYPTNQWQVIDGKQYFFNESGYMLTNTTTPDGQQLDANGVLIKDPLFDYDLENCHVTYIKHEISTDYEGNPCIIVYYNYTNKDSDAKSAMGNSCYIQAFQNGVECDRATISYSDNNQAVKNHYKNVLTGTTIEVAEAFKISDKSDITIILEDIFDWTGKSPELTVVLTLQ